MFYHNLWCVSVLRFSNQYIDITDITAYHSYHNAKPDLYAMCHKRLYPLPRGKAGNGNRNETDKNGFKMALKLWTIRSVIGTDSATTGGARLSCFKICNFF